MGETLSQQSWVGLYAKAASLLPYVQDYYRPVTDKKSV